MPTMFWSLMPMSKRLAPKRAQTGETHLLLRRPREKEVMCSFMNPNIDPNVVKDRPSNCILRYVDAKGSSTIFGQMMLLGWVWGV